MHNFGAEVMSRLDYEPNQQQVELIARAGHFLMRSPQGSVFVLGGYAGTGKTSLTGAVVKTLTAHGARCVLMAPTGRAAKVFADYATHPAYTIHRKIYRQQAYGSAAFGLAPCLHEGTVFIVDEASMISNTRLDGGGFGTGCLLDDLIRYVYSGANCRLMLIGDRAQLPPVGGADSPALSAEVLQGYGLNVYEAFLTDVARQSRHSGILHNATALREMMRSGALAMPTLRLTGFTDISTVGGDMLQETIGDCYDRDGTDETIVITRSNRRAAYFNMGIRNQILYREDRLSSGDMLLVCKNNYYWSRQYTEMDFVANGDIVRLTRLHGDGEERYGLHFADATVEFPYHDNLEMDVKVILDTLASDTPALSAGQSRRLLAEAEAGLDGDRRTRLRALKDDPYANALQVKYAYALTCHKAQGGQWKNVFIDMGYLPEEAFGQLDFFRWLYTAISRARGHCYLINSPLPTV